MSTFEWIVVGMGGCSLVLLFIIALYTLDWKKLEDTLDWRLRNVSSTLSKIEEDTWSLHNVLPEIRESLLTTHVESVGAQGEPIYVQVPWLKLIYENLEKQHKFALAVNEKIDDRFEKSFLGLIEKYGAEQEPEIGTSSISDDALTTLHIPGKFTIIVQDEHENSSN